MADERPRSGGRDQASSDHSAGAAAAPSVQLLFGAAALMILAQLAFRAWALYGSWFFTDDYRLLLDAREGGAGLDHLLTPFDSHLMPLVRLVVWTVAESGTLNWPLAATTTLVLQLLASAACLWMLITLFGLRWFVLLPLSVYLTSAVTAAAFMWWAAALNQLPLQVAFFCSVTLWVRYLRTRRWRCLLLTVLAVAVSVAFYEKSLVLGVVLAYLALWHFAAGTVRQRISSVLRRYWPAAAVGGALAGAYLAYYAVHVPRPFGSNEAGDFVADDVAETMIGTTIPTGLVGGPWQWFDTSPPIVLAGPPPWAVHLAWMALLLVVLYGALRRTRTMRAWGLLAAHVVCLYVILAVSRGQIFGGLSGLEYRYVSDVVCTAVLVLGLVFAELRGAVESSAPRSEPLLTWEAPSRVVVLATAIVGLGGLVSTAQYVHFWHDDNAGEGYVKTFRADVDEQGPVDLANQVMPADVMPAYTEPRNQTEVFAPLVSTKARFPTISDDLHVLGPDGSLERAVIEGGVTSRPGPVTGCGWRIGSGSVTIPLESPTFSFTWWVRIGYLGTGDDTVTVRIGGETFDAPVERGLHELFVEVTDEFSGVTLGGLESGTTLCVDQVQVGGVSPEGSG